MYSVFGGHCYADDSQRRMTVAPLTRVCFSTQSVFKNYDHDQNGFICQDDFEKIAASFPFSFCVMDKEK